MSKKIFITGGSGFLGEKVVSQIVKKTSYDLIVLSRRATNSKERRIKFVKGDLLDKNSYEEYIKSADMVIHIAGKFNGNKKELMEVNIQGTKNIVDLCKNKKLIFISSENILFDKSVYAESKRKAEEFVKATDKYIILRPTIIYGQNDRRNLGKFINWCKHWPIIFIPGNGKGLMRPIFVKDVASYIVNSIGYNKNAIFMLGGGTIISIDNFVDEIGNILKKRIIKFHVPLFMMFPFVKLNELLKNPIVTWNQLKNINTERLFNIDKTIKELNHNPITIKEGLQEILK